MALSLTGLETAIDTAAARDNQQTVNQRVVASLHIIAWSSFLVKTYDDNANFVESLTISQLPHLPVAIAGVDVNHAQFKIVLELKGAQVRRFIDEDVAIVDRPLPPVALPPPAEQDNRGCKPRCRTVGSMAAREIVDFESESLTVASAAAPPENPADDSGPSSSSGYIIALQKRDRRGGEPQVALKPLVEALRIDRSDTNARTASPVGRSVTAAFARCGDGTTPPGHVSVTGFASRSKDLTEDQRMVLEYYSGHLKSTAESGGHLLVGGYADATGSEQSDTGLSWRRATAVKDFLVHQGIPADSISAAAFGSGTLHAPEGTNGPSECDRRVEILTVVRPGNPVRHGTHGFASDLSDVDADSTSAATSANGMSPTPSAPAAAAVQKDREPARAH